MVRPSGAALAAAAAALAQRPPAQQQLGAAAAAAASALLQSLDGRGVCSAFEGAASPDALAASQELGQHAKGAQQLQPLVAACRCDPCGCGLRARGGEGVSGGSSDAGGCGPAELGQQLQQQQQQQQQRQQHQRQQQQREGGWETSPSWGWRAHSNGGGTSARAAPLPTDGDAGSAKGGAGAGKAPGGGRAARKGGGAAGGAAAPAAAETDPLAAALGVGGAVAARTLTPRGLVENLDARDVDEIVKDLVEASLTLTRTRLKAALAERAAADAEERILRDLCGELSHAGVYETFRQLYREGQLDDRMVEVTLGPQGGAGGGDTPFAAIFKRMGLQPPPRPGGPRRGGGPVQKQKMLVREARQLLVDQEAERWLSSELVTRDAVRAAQEDGIVFIDEIDKIAVRGGVGTGGSVSSEGVQRDLLPILEGSAVSTKYGNVSTDLVLFIASGAFHSAKPSDLLAELHGRLPVRVELKGLTRADLYRILTEPANNMIRQQQALLATEGVELVFTDEAVHAVAAAAEEANQMLDNIGVRRLHIVLERVLADISFSASERVAAARQAAGGGGPAGAGKRGGGAPPVRHEVTAADVEAAVGELLKKVDLSKYML